MPISLLILHDESINTSGLGEVPAVFIWSPRIAGSFELRNNTIISGKVICGTSENGWGYLDERNPGGLQLVI